MCVDQPPSIQRRAYLIYSPCTHCKKCLQAHNRLPLYHVATKFKKDEDRWITNIDNWYMIWRDRTIIVHVAVYLCLLAFNVNPVIARFSIRDKLLNLGTWCLKNKEAKIGHWKLLNFSWTARTLALLLSFRACLHGGGGPQVGGVTHLFI